MLFWRSIMTMPVYRPWPLDIEILYDQVNKASIDGTSKTTLKFTQQMCLIKSDSICLYTAFFSKILDIIRNIFIPSWSYGSWIYNYLCNQCLSPPRLWVRVPLMARCTRCVPAQHYVIKFVSDLRQVGGFLRFHLPVTLITTI